MGRDEDAVFNLHVAGEVRGVHHPNAIADDAVVVERDVPADDAAISDATLLANRRGVTHQAVRADDDIEIDDRVRAYRAIGADAHEGLELYLASRRAGALRLLPYDRAVDVQIGRLRKKIESDPATPMLIKSVRGAGYIFSDTVRQE